jgi:hypothetical protein
VISLVISHPRFIEHSKSRCHFDFCYKQSRTFFSSSNNTCHIRKQGSTCLSPCSTMIRERNSWVTPIFCDDMKIPNKKLVSSHRRSPRVCVQWKWTKSFSHTFLNTFWTNCMYEQVLCLFSKEESVFQTPESSESSSFLTQYKVWIEWIRFCKKNSHWVLLDLFQTKDFAERVSRFVWNGNFLRFSYSFSRFHKSTHPFPFAA